ncbi:MAG: preprotein translocase subunit SecG [Candidatus Colwellbacteria bacterium RIFCSPLOWO2_01_FULL_48_10]|uniref:Preprotein translocase subunit SecG n=1 Tax=Candidatus Colwellbacteria bacterium RIFCSPLOWO2_01_FULL_48_10 TaxID=1797690 RepID=A0A1G1Z8D8_9BACT|nr:MAG: preprotein translocase subunit SecG [Candidatus Colwellbacteria bacterium RIFCSPLOWO2_01_FULL_48_10]
MLLINIGLITISVIAIGLVLIQDRSSATGGAFGVGEGTFYQRRRGIERFVFIATVVVIAAFAGFAIGNLLTTDKTTSTGLPEVELTTDNQGVTVTPVTEPVSPAGEKTGN